MELPSLLGHAAQLLRLMYKSGQPSDRLASSYFRSKKYIGARDRRFVSELAFSALRIRSLVQHCVDISVERLPQPHNERFAAAAPARGTRKRGDAPITPAPYEMAVISAACVIGDALDVYPARAALAEVLRREVATADERLAGVAEAFAVKTETPPPVARTLLEQCRSAAIELDIWATEVTAKTDPMPSAELERVAAAACVQPWIMRSWITDKRRARTASESLALARSLWKGAPLCLRVNRMVADRDSVVQRFKAQGIAARAGSLSPDCVVIERRVNLRETEEFKHGVVEVQDEASQMLAFALDPAPGDLILDGCAGAGGKSLHIATLAKDQGTVLATDIEYARLKEAPIRARRAGLRSVRALRIGRGTASTDLPKALTQYAQRCDAVVVDAPCSGMGVVRRMPMPKWRLNAALLRKLNRMQFDALERYAQCVRPGGTLLYATCSLMPEENEAIVERFLAKHEEFAPEAIGPSFARWNIDIAHIDVTSACITFDPAAHATDGFFIARMIRNA